MSLMKLSIFPAVMIQLDCKASETKNKVQQFVCFNKSRVFEIIYIQFRQDDKSGSELANVSKFNK